jgi:hypothetical protein
MVGARVTRVSIFAVPVRRGPGQVPRRAPFQGRSPAQFGSRSTASRDPLNSYDETLLTIRYFMDTRRRRGRKSDAEPIDW